MQLLRSHIFSIYVVLLTVVLTVVFLPTMAMPRKAALWAAKVWARAVLGGLKAICGVSYRVIGAEHIPRGPALLAINHQSAWETFALVCLAPDPAVILKRELMRIPIYGWWAAKLKMIPIDRSAGARALRRMTTAAGRALADGRQIIIFPQGARTPPGEHRRYQPGVAAIYAAADVPCTPAAHNSGLYWTHPGALKKPGEIVLEFLPAIAPGLERKEFMSRLRSAIDERADVLAAAAAARSDLAASGATLRRGAPIKE